MGNESQSAISAIQGYISGLTESQKVDFAKINGIDLSKIDLLNYNTAERLCKSLKLDYKKDSAWDLYNKGKAMYEEATERYNAATTLFNYSKNNLTKAKEKYKQLQNEFLANKNKNYKMSSAEKSSLASKAGYTQQLITSTNDAEIEQKLALDARFEAVDTQRHGLYFQG